MSMSKDQLFFDPASASDSDSVGAYLRSSDGTLITHTTVSGKEALDVNVVNDVNVALAAGSEIKITDGTDTLAINTDGSINAAVTGTVAVTATALDIRALAFATDKVDVSGSTVELGATTLAALESITVTATALDIRAISAATDSIEIKNGSNALAVNSDGSINVKADLTTVNNFEKAEDAAHVSGDIGAYMLSVRQDVLAGSTSASGDYQSIKTDALGRLYNNSAAQTSLVSAVTVGNTAAPLLSASLGNRTKVIIQNTTQHPIFIGHDNTVTSANGFIVMGKNTFELEVSDNVALYAIAAANADVRVLEVA